MNVPSPEDVRVPVGLGERDLEPRDADRVPLALGVAVSVDWKLGLAVGVSVRDVLHDTPRLSEADCVPVQEGAPLRVRLALGL